MSHLPGTQSELTSRLTPRITPNINSQIMILTMTRFTEPPLAIACLITSLRKYIKNPKIIIVAMICETVIICVPSLIRDRLQDRIVLFVVIRHHVRQPY